MAASIRLRAAAFTHQGAVRAANEDTLAVGAWIMGTPMAAPAVLERVVEAPLVCLVADGLGGHAAGEVASRIVAEYLVQQADRAGDPLTLAALLGEVHALLFERMRADPSLRGMGTTVAGIVVEAAGSLVFNVGDSRVYRIARASPSGDRLGATEARVPATKLLQLSTDDTPGPKLADGHTAALTSHLITQSLGGASEAEGIVPHVLVDPRDDRARYLICSNGLSDLLPRAALEACLRENDRASIEALFEAAMSAGGTDNISIVMVDLRRA